MDDSLDNGASVKKQSFSAKLAFVGSFNLALQQNAVKAVYELKLKNDLGRDLRNLKCEFSASPELISPKTVTVEELKDGEELALHDLGIELDYRFLAELSEALNGKLKLRIGDGGTVLFDREYDVTAYAPDQWLGLNVMPELIAAFVTPNMEVVSHLMTTVGEELKQATGSSSIQGYQQDKTRVYEICSAIYRAIHSWGIQYAEPPSSFGDPGQRIRFADTVYHYRLGTCLDTTLLFASVMEQCGLHPVIMLTQGHAYIGCHLIDRYFNDLPMDDLQVIRKLVDLDEFLVIETTMVTDGHATFSQAEAAARGEHLNIDDKFYCAIDIVRARYSGIRPLPLSRSVNGIEFQPAERQAEKLGEENKRKLQQEVDLDRLSAEDPRGGRVARWTQKLLDLSLRNRLLNARDNRQIIPIACPDITALEDRIAANEEMALKALPELLSEKDVHDLAMLRNSEVKSDIKKLLDRELSQKRLWSILPPAELGKRLTYLYRQSRTDLEEGGVNTLFLAIGFLEWKVSERDSRSYLAPILLIPVRMSRKSIVEGIRISRIDEDTVINETLLELLRSQFQLTVPGISPLPTDASGVDVGMVMQIFRQTIRDMKGWEVREEAKIGHFSFGKFIMWNDMTNRIGDLKKHPLVRHLIEGGGIFDDGIEVFPPEKIGSHLNLHKLYCPLGADSSQLTAVLYSALGKSFVLHGPPGTGKSQTITNIIAHNLALGRRVLFVSEKKAALDVVHKRLSAVGLKPFCLELHSNKSGKAEVLKQFSDALQVPDTAPPAEWEKNIRALELTRAALGGYVNELHRRFPNGFSAYDCFSRLFPMCGKKLGGPTLPIRCLRQTPEEYEKLCGAVAALASAWEGTSPQACEALRKLDPAAWSPVFEKELRDSAAALAAAIRKLRDALAVTAELLPVKDNLAMDSVYRLAILTELFKHCGDIPENFLDGDFAKHAEFVSGYAANAVCCWELGEKLKNYRLESFPDFDFPGIAERLERNDRSFFPIGFIKNLMLVRELAVLKKTGGVKLSVSELRALLPDAEKYVSARAAVERGKQEAAALLGEVWNGDSTRWDDVGTTLKKTEEILKALRELTSDDDEEYRTLLRKLRTFLPRAEQTFRQEGELRKRINGFLAAWNDLQETLRDFSKYASQLASPPRLDELDTELSGIIANLDELRGVMVFRQQEDEAGKLGAAALPVALRAGQVAPAALTAKFDEMFFRTMLEQILAVSPALCAFNGGSRNGTIRKFCELDKEYTSLTRRIVFAKLAATLPRRRSGPCPEGTELGVLKRECEKRARQKPVRQLLEQIPKLAAILKPCFLMSPLSVAQYLPPDSEPFDLVVFDEASQIPVWDAIGVIARGRQLIVVGDPKQMPPTNFFQKGDADAPEDAPEELEDMESILDECIAAGVYPTYLNWHYRSRHEALISFSNHYYYEDRLFTFPAARDTDKLGVRFEFVGDGVYDRKASRTNRREAKALVDYIFRHLEKSSKPRSIGVVTFSQAQRDLIEDMVEHERTKHPKLEEYFGDGNEDPMFVKNLENVQGDERDVILFSIGYAPDAEGRMSMNFGPLNRQGGERRLNVAITRAREQVVVFSSIHAEQIDLARTSAVGAAHLKYFLDYAENGVHVRSGSADDSLRDGLAETIAGFLKSQEYEVDRGVGGSEYRIDLAVRHPERPREYLLGIECDGPGYARQKTTRDRDSLRSSVLSNLGWHLYRAWSVDWALDRRRAEQELLELIGRLKDESGKPEPEPEPEHAPKPAPAPEPTPASAIPAKSANRGVYRVWPGVSQLPQEQFYEPAGARLIRAQMAAIIAVEGPIYAKLLKKRVSRAWGFARIGDNIRRVLDCCLPRGGVRSGEDIVFYPPGMTAADFRIYRVAEDENAKRAIDEIPPVELANAMREVLIDFNSCEEETLFRETMKMFGFSAVTLKAKKYLEYGRAALKASGRI